MQKMQSRFVVFSRCHHMKLVHPPRLILSPNLALSFLDDAVIGCTGESSENSLR
jgi:hypothetical protein